MIANSAGITLAFANACQDCVGDHEAEEVNLDEVLHVAFNAASDALGKAAKS